MTDFLHQLEDDLRIAAERRGRPPRRRPTGALKAVAAVAVLALLVVGAARLAGRDDTDQAAAPTPGPGHPDVAYATGGHPALLELLSARARGYRWTDIPDGAHTADPSLGSVVLYRPGAEEKAREAAFVAEIDAVRPLTEADERSIHSDAPVIVVYGPEREQRMLRDPEICTPAGGELKLCVDRSDEQRYSAFVLGDDPLPVEPLNERGWWSWAATSPDGATILAQWSGYECDGRRAVLIADGASRPLSDGPSKALGWTTDGRAIVAGDCGEDGHYLVAPDGTREPVELEQPPEPSLRPVDLDG